MPKSYKICLVDTFDVSQVSPRALSLNRQSSFSGIPSAPQTKLWISPDQISFQDFQAYEIIHEYEVSFLCRINDTDYEKVIRRGMLKAYYSPNLKLLFLSGKKADVLDFCKTSKQRSILRFSTLLIEMKNLLEKISSVNTAWFRFPKGLIHASGLMGSHLEKTVEFVKCESEGDISALSFYFGNENSSHPIMVTRDGTVVLNENYINISDEVNLVYQVKEKILEGIYSLQPVK